MKAISRWLDRFCYNHPNFGIPNLMKFIVIGNVWVLAIGCTDSAQCQPGSRMARPTVTPPI